MITGGGGRGTRQLSNGGGIPGGVRQHSVHRGHSIRMGDKGRKNLIVNA